MVHGVGSSWGDAGFARKAWDWIKGGGPVSDHPYFGGSVPLPGIGRIGSYAEMAKITKGYKGAIQSHKLVEARFLKDRGIPIKDAPAVIIDKVTHSEITTDLIRDIPTGRNINPTNLQLIEHYNRVYSDPMWISIVKAFLGY